MDNLAKTLLSWAKNKIGSIPKEIKRVKEELNNNLNDERKPYKAQMVTLLENRLEKLLDQEETHWRQRSRNQWLAEGDRNTTFFHRAATDRRRKNKINRLEDDQGRLRNTQDQIEDLVLEFYPYLFSTSDPSNEDITLTTNLISKVVTEDMNRKLNIPFTEDNIRKATFDLNPNKAPGLDGFTILFFQKEWHIMGKDVTKEALNCLNNSERLDNNNSTIITLVPKTKDPYKIKDYRPISLCNVFYKILVRAITNRLKNILGNIIDPYQSAFTPCRSITDNILIGYECMHWFR